MPPTLEQYFARFGFCPPAIETQPAAGLGLVVVVPVFDEPRPVEALEALAACRAPTCPVEVIAVVNAPEGCPPEVAARTAQSFSELERWIARAAAPGLAFHLLHHPALPPRQAGVGLARKIGMDEAAARLYAAGTPRGVIAGFDADCRCAPTYLAEMAAWFGRHPETGAATVFFEHPLDGGGDPALAEAAVQYELFLRYFAAGLRFAGYPFPHHTLGSCMAVRAENYLAQGGMNRRQAGEDFYFLSKFMRRGHFGEIRGTTVYPAARPSHRVPFGTGRALRDLLAGGEAPLAAYPPEIFRDLRTFLLGLPTLFRAGERELNDFLRGLPAPLGEFLEQADFGAQIERMNRTSAAEPAFAGHFFAWFDRFKVLKFAQFGARGPYPREPVGRAALRLLDMRGDGPPRGAETTPRALLAALRREERTGPG